MTGKTHAHPTSTVRHTPPCGKAVFAILFLLMTCPVHGQVETTPAAGAPPAAARFATGSGAGQIGVLADTPNLENQGPEAIASAPDGGLFILDTVNRRIVALPMDGESAAQTVDLPQVDYAKDLVVTERFFYVLDSSRRQVLSYDRQGHLVASLPVEAGVDLGGSVRLAVLGEEDLRIQLPGGGEVAVGKGQTRGLSDSTTLLTRGGTLESRFQRESTGQGRVTLKGTGQTRGGASALEVDSEGFLASADLVAVDERGRYHVLVEALQSAAAVFDVNTTLSRYSQAGELEASVSLSIEAAVHLPNRFVTVRADGHAYFLLPTAEQVTVQALEFLKPGAGPKPRGMPATPADEDAAPGDASAMEEAFQKAVRGAYPDENRTRARGAGISRQRIIDNARSYMGHRWVLDRRNYQSDRTASRCRPANGQLWQRPSHLEDGMGREFEGVPYKWGGYDSLERYDDRLRTGYLAGDICTCRSNTHNYCITQEAAGVDCSGFVSRALEENYYTTSRLHEVTERLSRWEELRPGDILNRAGNHVRLFVGFSDENALVLHTIESSKSCGKVCAASYKVSQLSRYVPRRYHGVVD